MDNISYKRHNWLNFSIYLLVVLGLLAIILPSGVDALRPTIKIKITSPTLVPNRPVNVEIQILSNERLQNDSLEIIWGDGQKTLIPCALLSYAAPAQTCKVSSQHIYNKQGSYEAQITACSVFPGTNKVDQCQVAQKMFNIGGPKGYDNPLKWNNVFEFLKYILRILFWAAVIFLMFALLLGSYYIMTSGNSPLKRLKGVKIILWALLGFVIILLGKAIIGLIQHFQ